MCLCAPLAELYTPRWSVFGGFSIIEADEDTLRLLNVITHQGVFKVKGPRYGPKQGPPLYQQVQDHAVGQECKLDGDKLADLFFDDTHVADDDAESYIASLCQLLQCARRNNIQHRLVKCYFSQSSCKLFGVRRGICWSAGRS